LTHAAVELTPIRRAIRSAVAHLAVFAGLAVLLCAAGTMLRHPPRRVFLAVVAIAAVYGIFDEVTQQFVVHRKPDFLDWIADMFGACVGITFFSIAREIVLAIGRRLTVT
jgi:VanZ family protein